nr:nucleotidyltransferase family protein [Eubacterium sp.]
MSVTGIICEYNPFHKGHQYHIQKAREVTGADTIVAVMNGDFVQRGEPAIVDKYTRTKMALEGGADLVFELPVRYGVSSAEDFAYGGILALESLGFVDQYCFGSEAVEQQLLVEAGQYFANESQDYKDALGKALRQGLSYPAAREQAFREKVGRHEPERWTEEVVKALFSPNNILALEYMKAAEKLGSSMKSVAIQRCGMGYHERLEGRKIGDEECFLSATAIRELLLENGETMTGMSEECLTCLAEVPYRLTAQDFWGMCAYAIRDKWEELEQYKDVSEELAGAFRKSWQEAVSFSDFVNRCKTKNITMSRVKRGVFQVLLDVKKQKERSEKLPYLRLLGMRQEAAPLLGEISDTVLIGRVAKDKQKLTAGASELFEQDIRAADIYRNVAMAKAGVILPAEYQRPVILV